MLQAIEEFLLCRTPNAWIAQALQHPEILLIDHANCEKKAASTALNLMYRYVSNIELLNKMSRLAREELRHFEQVLAIMQRRKIPYRQISASRYAAELRKHVRPMDPEKLVDTLIVGAIIEARSCERFRVLSGYLPDEVRALYEQLERSEARHFEIYLQFAEREYDPGEIAERLALISAREAELATAPDATLRFHSGPPG